MGCDDLWPLTSKRRGPCEKSVILLAYVVSIPANEIVIPTVLMLTGLTFGTLPCRLPEQALPNP